MLSHKELRLPILLTSLIGGLGIVAIVLGVTIASQGSRSAAGTATDPLALAVSEDTGSLSGGETIEISGRHLTGVTEVRFGGVPATAVSSDAGVVSVVVPAAESFVADTVAVTVHTRTELVDTAEPLTWSYATVTSVDRQLAYALTHWSTYNSAQFGDLNPIGGDCMNFVSQTLLARGWVMTDEWYSADGGARWGDPWGHVPSFDEWLRAHPEYGATTVALDDRSAVALGDLVVFDWDGDGSLDHIQIVSSITETDGVISIGMAGHNLDSDFRDLDVVLTVDHPGATGYFWSIP